jgi:ribonuclease P protein component
METFSPQSGGKSMAVSSANPVLTQGRSLLTFRAPKMPEPAPARQKILIYETPVSTVENPPQTPARISQPQFEQERQGHARQSPSQRPQTPDAGLIFVSAPAAMPKRLGRSARIQPSGDFARIRQQGQRLALGCLIANWQRLPEGSKPKLGVITSKKIGGAVQRNRARRLLRESFRQHQNELNQSVEIILVARNSIAGRKFAEVEKDYLAALRRAGLLKQL